MFGNSDNNSPKNRIGFIAEVTKMLGGASDLKLIELAQKPVLDFVQYLRDRNQTPTERGELKIEILVHTTTPEGEPETEIVTGKLTAKRELVMSSRTKLKTALNKFVSNAK